MAGTPEESEAERTVADSAMYTQKGLNLESFYWNSTKQGLRRAVLILAF